jgi:hypothetical protein
MEEYEKRILARDFGSPMTTQGGGPKMATKLMPESARIAENKKRAAAKQLILGVTEAARQKRSVTLAAIRSRPANTDKNANFNAAFPDGLIRHKKKNYHNKMPRSYRKRSGSRKSGGFALIDGQAVSSKNFYYDKLLGKRVERPNSERRRAGIKDDAVDWATDTFGYSAQLATPKQLLNRRMRGYTGKGMYGGQGKYGLGKAMNRARGYIAGATKLAGAGMAAYNTIKGFSGGGMYGGQGEYHSNALVEGGASSMTVHGQSDETDSITLTNREYVKDIYAPFIAATTNKNSSSGFGSETIQINPGLAEFAPKLAAIAANYQQYELLQLVFEIKPLITESNVNNGITGSIMMVFNYDANSDPYDNKEDVMQSSGAVSGRIVDNLTCGVECDTGKTKDTEYYVRTCPVPFGRDADEFDHGNLCIATNGIPEVLSNATIAELYVYYTVELRHFKPGTVRLNGQQRDLYTLSGAASNTRTELQTPGLHFDNFEVVKAQQSNLGTQLSRVAGNDRSYLVKFPASFNGFVEIRISTEGTSLVATNPSTVIGGTQITQVKDMYGGGAVGDAPSGEIFYAGTTSNVYIGRFKVRAATSGTDNTITITGAGVGGGTVTQWALEINELSQNFWQSRGNPVPVFQNISTNLIQTA